jgi:hypothetical protein
VLIGLLAGLAIAWGVFYPPMFHQAYREDIDHRSRLYFPGEWRHVSIYTWYDTCWDEILVDVAFNNSAPITVFVVNETQMDFMDDIYPATIENFTFGYLAVYHDVLNEAIDMNEILDQFGCQRYYLLLSANVETRIEYTITERTPIPSMI